MIFSPAPQIQAGPRTATASHRDDRMVDGSAARRADRMTLLEHGAMAADLVDIVRASTTEIVVVVCVVPSSVPSRVTLARPAPLRLLARASRMHTSSIASNTLIASVKFNLGDGGEFDSGERSEDEELGGVFWRLKRLAKSCGWGRGGDQDDEHKDDENVGSSSKNKGKKRVPDNDDPETLIEMLALIAGEGDVTKVAEEHKTRGINCPGHLHRLELLQWSHEALGEDWQKKRNVEASKSKVKFTDL
ncbi:hypothetical protein HO133_006835 [Letharia lupina]|uniref:Uncharacterized protein n=1 Tax=Letharia lupina TaxID=560253 RepID=A0A8H6C5H3_9LECA|nr:uncharacterized protein HO133_006835 [Letharia lupina]KAF6217497.1 hypothetical protein HO133_006835 [Letharia lupina]